MSGWYGLTFGLTNSFRWIPGSDFANERSQTICGGWFVRFHPCAYAGIDQSTDVVHNFLEPIRWSNINPVNFVRNGEVNRNPVVVTLSFNAKMVLANFECNLND